MLARPKKVQKEEFYVREERSVPLWFLAPRLRYLARPKHVTPKFVKAKEGSIKLPGVIRDWEG